MRATLALVFGLLALPATAEEVDVELFLAVDVSQSMSLDELDIQRRGYANAIASAEVIEAITGGPLGVIALTYVEWAGEGRHRTVVPWTRIASAEDARAVAETISYNFETTLRGTSISSILLAAENSIETNAFQGLRKVIDVSGDGPNNVGPMVTAARDRVLARGITINGLPLLTRDAADIWGVPDLDAYYLNCVIGGPAAFVLPVRDWPEFPAAIRRKLVLELSAAPPRPEAAKVWQAQAPAQTYDCLIGEKIWRRNMQRGFFDP